MRKRNGRPELVVGFTLSETKRWRKPEPDSRASKTWKAVVLDAHKSTRTRVDTSITNKRGSFINVYSVSRHYGGAEEGGWWYDWYHLVKSVPVRNNKALTMRLVKFLKKYSRHAMGDIYSVLGGEQIYVRLEQFVGESQSTERPHYE